MKVILTSSLGGNTFSLFPGQLVEVSKEDGNRLIDNGLARDLLASLNEPTELQLSTEFTLSRDAEEIEKSGEVVEPKPAPTRQRRQRVNNSSQS